MQRKSSMIVVFVSFVSLQIHLNQYSKYFLFNTLLSTIACLVSQTSMLSNSSRFLIIFPKTAANFPQSMQLSHYQYSNHYSFSLLLSRCQKRVRCRRHRQRPILIQHQIQSPHPFPSRWSVGISWVRTISSFTRTRKRWPFAFRHLELGCGSRCLCHMSDGVIGIVPTLSGSK
jgi:hypothetical protein